MAFTQKGLICAITTPLNEDVLLLRKFSGNEGMSQLFQYRVELLSENDSLDFKTLVGQSVTIKLALADGSWRYFNGVIARFSQEGRDERFAVYQAEIVPWLWLLTRRTDCRIFQNKSVPEILKKVFEELQFSDYEFKLKPSDYAPWVYCVQYRETDFNFVSRLMEQEGIFYYFRHEDGRHVLVIGDSPTQNPDCPGQPQATYMGEPGGLRPEDEISAWLVEQELQPGKYTLTDYNFMDPSASLEVGTSTSIQVGKNERFEIFDYPGEYVNLGEESDPKLDHGNRWVKLRMQAEEAAAVIVNGRSNCRAFTPGFRFQLRGHYRPNYDKPYLITSVQHTVSQAGGYVSGVGDGETTYENNFTCIPHATPYRPMRSTPKPLIQGPQTAVVVTHDGSEIEVDEHARVRVKFHWIRPGKAVDDRSCWVRVSQGYAGKNWGEIRIPRAGQEVIVEFLEGDPDQPIITGRVYNAEQMPPYGLPDNMTQSGIKSCSSEGGGGFNEIRLEDKKGAEEMSIHAQKNMNTTVEHDQTNTVHNSFTETIKSDAVIKITEGTYSHDVAGSTATYHVKGDVTEDFDAKHTQTVVGDQTLTVKAKRTASITGDDTLTVAGKLAADVLGETSITSKAKITLTVGPSTVEVAPIGITLTCGGSTVKIDPAGVAITAAKIALNG